MESQSWTFNKEEAQVGAFSGPEHCKILRMFVVGSIETGRGSAGAGGWCVGGCWLTPVAEGGEAAVRPLASVPSPVSSSPGRHRHHHLSTAQCPPGLQPDNTPRKIFLSSKNILCDGQNLSSASRNLSMVASCLVMAKIFYSPQH